ncbi:hypothetical protein JANAI62_01910 [Jannaschia pagri]|uniref:Uncharacterized protein n=1 Tax=Jannaschia pagri TaxID=2829797 RepID=A0ABQ4NGL5_9RHOB|nr:MULTISPECIES: hypothetical protein [unclassified Jannaschia]GIT90326.1 hypothetical protein JANAI61_07840 [Jannaschia sp. AI_61]GIT93568.1 hypothetical protein JANAI62_01910 [Jannaschia sp. AI_62]
MGTRIIVMAISLLILGGAGYASWYGIGAVSSDTGVGSVRTGSGGGVGVARVRVK